MGERLSACDPGGHNHVVELMRTLDIGTVSIGEFRFFRLAISHDGDFNIHVAEMATLINRGKSPMPRTRFETEQPMLVLYAPAWIARQVRSGLCYRAFRLQKCQTCLLLPSEGGERRTMSSMTRSGAPASD